MTNALATALADFRPVIAARYVNLIQYGFNQLTSKFGSSMNGVYNSESYKFFTETVRPCLKNIGGQVVAGRQEPAHYVINDEALARRADEYAAAAVEAFRVKIEGKMGELESATVRSMGAGSFVISGTKNGTKVTIEQEMILNQSSKGTLFNQFPARIYVEGKFTSEAKFKKMFT